MSYYNIPTGNQTAGFYEIFKYVSGDVTNGLFFPVILLVVWIIAFLGLKQYSTSRAWTFASFFCAILSIIMGVLDLINPRWMYLTIMMTLIGFIWLKLETT